MRNTQALWTIRQAAYNKLSSSVFLNPSGNYPSGAVDPYIWGSQDVLKLNYTQRHNYCYNSYTKSAIILFVLFPSLIITVIFHRMASKSTRKWTCSEALRHYGFENIPDWSGDRPKCVLCCKVLINESLKPGKLKEHLMKCPPESASQNITSLQQKANNLQPVKFEEIGYASKQLAAAAEASYEVAYWIAKSQKPHRNTEEWFYCTES